jgi:hypothetical protein
LKDGLGNFGFEDHISIEEFIKILQENGIWPRQINGVGVKVHSVIERIVNDAGFSNEISQSADSMSEKIIKFNDVYIGDFQVRAANALERGLSDFGYTKNTSVEEFIKMVQKHQILLSDIPGIGVKAQVIIERIVDEAKLSIEISLPVNSLSEKIMSLASIHDNGFKLRTLNVLKRGLMDFGYTKNTSVYEFVEILEDNRIILGDLAGMGVKGQEIIETVVNESGLSLEKSRQQYQKPDKMIEKMEFTGTNIEYLLVRDILTSGGADVDYQKWFGIQVGLTDAINEYIFKYGNSTTYENDHFEKIEKHMMAATTYRERVLLGWDHERSSKTINSILYGMGSHRVGTRKLNQIENKGSIDLRISIDKGLKR